MSLNKEFLNRDSNITVNILKDSVSDTGYRMVTFELEYMRYIHAEIMTHRMLSKNCSSSRAIPVNKMLEQIEKNMAVPVYLGKNKSGMQAVEEVENKNTVLDLWESSYKQTRKVVEELLGLGLHKQIANRLTESYQMMKVVVSATDWDNFFNLRFEKDAQPEFLLLASKMYAAMQESRPRLLRAGEWHLPYVEISQSENPEDTYYFYYDVDTSGTETDGCMYEVELTLEEAIKRSVASCASVSYRTESLSPRACEDIHNMLIHSGVVHASPFEHQGTPMKVCRWSMDGSSDMNLVDDVETWEDGITHMKRTGDLCSGNLTGFIQHRHLIANNTCNNFDFNKRYEDFCGK